MTNKEAYQLIESCLEYDKDMSENPEAYGEAIRLAKEVFDKQEPMKVYERSFGDGTVQLECPKCHREALKEWHHPHCWNCGQKLYWGD